MFPDSEDTRNRRNRRTCPFCEMSRRAYRGSAISEDSVNFKNQVGWGKMQLTVGCRMLCKMHRIPLKHDWHDIARGHACPCHGEPLEQGALSLRKCFVDNIADCQWFLTTFCFAWRWYHDSKSNCFLLGRLFMIHGQNDRNTPLFFCIFLLP